MSESQDHPAQAQVQADPWQARRQGGPPDGQHRPPVYHHYTQDDAYPPHPQNMNPLMRHQNYSVPSLPSQGPHNGQQDEVPPMPPPYEATEMLDSFNNMRISDPTARGTLPLNVGHVADPVPRAGTSMSMRSAASVQSQRMPISPHQAMRRMPPGRPYDVSSVHSVGSGQSAYHSIYSDGHEGSAETDATSLYSYYEDSSYQHPPPSQNGYPMHEGYPPPRGYPPPNWQGQHPGYGAHPPPPGPGQYNNLFAAASNVLGMAAPPGQPPAQGYPPPNRGYPPGAPPMNQGYPRGPPPGGIPPNQGYPQGPPPPNQGYLPGPPPPNQGYPQGPPPPNQGYPQGPPPPNQGYQQGSPPPNQGYPQGLPPGALPPHQGYPQDPSAASPPAQGPPDGTPAAGPPLEGAPPPNNASHEGFPADVPPPGDEYAQGPPPSAEGSPEGPPPATPVTDEGFSQGPPGAPPHPYSPAGSPPNQAYYQGLPPGAAPPGMGYPQGPASGGSTPLQGYPPGPPPGALPPQGYPPGAMPPPQAYPPGQAPSPGPPGQMPPQFYVNGPPPMAASQSVPYLPPGSYQGAPSIYSVSSQTSLARSSDTASLAPPSDEEVEFRNRRPSLQRSGTTASVAPRTAKTKAIDLSAPPYTKEYIDQYRQRIKDDPDPEAHFHYAKYLIEAAKRFGSDSDAKDQRNVKKYRDALIAESLKVMRRLATQTQAYDEAQFFLANCHGTGMLGLPVDHERAYHLYLQAAKQNHAAACYRIAVCNEIGAGTRREPQRALAFYRKAASLGDTAAMYKLGCILLRGLLGEQPNPREAVGWLKRAAEQADEENPHALHELALLYETQNSNIVPYDPAYAKELYTRAGHLGYTHSQYRLGQCHEYGHLTCPVDPRRSIAWYTKAAEKGHSEAELALSGWYLTGSEGVLKQSDSEAYLWARRAANKGLSKAEYAVGYYAEVGIGIKQDIEFAKRWYMRAAAQGNKRAMNRLTEMKRNGNKRANMARPTRQEAKDECVIV